MLSSSSSRQQKIIFWVFIGVFTLTCLWLVKILFSIERNDVDVLRFAHVYETSHPLHLGALNAASDIEMATNGRVVVKVYPASSLGKEMALNEALTLGVVDIIYTGTGFAGTTYGPISMTDFPYTLRNLNHWQAYKNSDLFKELSEGYRESTNGNLVAAISYFGTRQMLADRPILSPDEMKNLKIRVPDAPAYVMFPKIAGANPTPIAFSEAYLALQQGVVDGLDSPLQVFQAKRFYEVRKHVSLTNHIINSTLTIASGKRLNNLSVEDSHIVQSTLADSADWVTVQVQDAEKLMEDWLKNEGLSIHNVDVEPFRKIVQPALLEKGMPFSPELYARLQAIPDVKTLGGEN